VTPFNGEAFRFGLGSITFFLIILIHPPASLVRTGIFTGLFVVCFRGARTHLCKHQASSACISVLFPIWAGP
jgi:hypothetical protein